MSEPTYSIRALMTQLRNLQRDGYVALTAEEICKTLLVPEGYPEALCDCGMGDASMPILHADGCAVRQNEGER